jgi:hypothetical protein
MHDCYYMYMTATYERGQATGMRDELTAAGLVMQPVEPERLLADLPPDNPRMTEFCLPTAERMVAVPKDGHESQTRALLAQHGVAVFPQVGETTTLELWRVPPGTHRLSAIIHLVAVNPPLYGQLLRQAGAHLRGLANAELGGLIAYPERGILDQLAVAADREAPGGMRLHLVPPFEFAADHTIDDTVHGIGAELAMTGMFAEPDIAQIQDVVRQGYEYDGNGAVA